MSEPRILIDARKLGDGGIGTYIQNLIDGMISLRDKAQTNLRYSILIGKHTQVPARWHGAVEVYETNEGKYSLAEYCLLARRNREIFKRHELFHSPHYTLPYNLDLPAVVTVHDLIHITHPDTFYHAPAAKFLIASAIKRASAVISVSQHSCNQLAEHFPTSIGKTYLTYNSTRCGLGVGERYYGKINQERNVLGFVGSDRPHKGFQTFIHAYAQAAQSLAKSSAVRLPRVVVVGGRFSRKTRVEALQLIPTIEFRSELVGNALLQTLAAFGMVCISSKAEGFGLVALEALATGTRVICSPLPSLREVCGEQAYFASDFSEQALTQALLKALTDTDEHQRQLVNQGLLQSQKFSRRAQAQATLQVYERVLNQQLFFNLEPDQAQAA
ncbi:glycosyltransferase family 4 protein [bacterium]|nr:glycosyltransferase family 4 protein [bacterium]